MNTSQWPTNNYEPQQENRPPNRPNCIVQLIGPDHPQHPINVAKRQAEAAQKAAEQAAAAKAAAEAAAAAQPPAPEKPRRKRRSRRRPRAPQSEAAVQQSHLERHQRVCTVCNHEQREEIDREFLDWIHPENIARQYQIDWRAIYRHAHATGLFPARQRNLRAALGHIVQKAAWVQPTVDGVLRAIRAFSSLDCDGRWTEIPTHVVVSSGAQLAQTRLIVNSANALALPNAIDAAAQPEAPTGTEVLLDNDSK